MVTTDNSRDTVLLVAGARLFSLAPSEFETREALFARWGAAGPIVVKAIRPPRIAPVRPAQISAVSTRVEDLDDRDNIDDEVVVRLAAELRRLPPGYGKAYASRRLCEIALQRQAGSQALGAAASAFVMAIHDTHPLLVPGRGSVSFSEDYLRVAEAIRYGGIRLPSTDPGIEAAESLLALRERILEHTGFAVTDQNGQPYTISPVPGKATIISFVTNVCARWKPRCDRPLPQLQLFYDKYKDKAAIFAIAEEGRELFTEHLDGEQYTVPVFFNEDDSLREIFAGPGSHESFLFDGAGKLVLRAIGSRTQEQLSELVKKAGVQ
jgi:hypothetical protein